MLRYAERRSRRRLEMQHLPPRDRAGRSGQFPSLLKRHAHTVGINRPEFLGPPRLGLQRTVGMHLAAPLLVFGVQCLNTLYGQTHHGLVADLPRQDFVAHASDVEVRLAAVDTCISWRSSVAKSFLEVADLRPPLQRFRSVGSRKNAPLMIAPSMDMIDSIAKA